MKNILIIDIAMHYTSGDCSHSYHIFRTELPLKLKFKEYHMAMIVTTQEIN